MPARIFTKLFLPLLFVLCFLFDTTQGRGQGSDPEMIFDLVEKQPEYPGGDAALSRFIEREIRYPVEAKDQGVQGTVFVEFVVSSTGVVDPATVKVTKSIHPLLDSEAVRIVKKMPQWKPGIQKNVPVNVRCKLPFKFSLTAEPGGNSGKQD